MFIWTSLSVEYSFFCFENEESIDTTRKSDKEDSVHLSHIPPQEGDEEEVKKRKGLKTLTLNNLLIRLSILLAQINARSNSYKLKQLNHEN